MINRSSGILLHITSLSSHYGIGDLGPGAYRFINFLSKTKQTYWQILPLNLTSPALGNSPYSSFSAFAGNDLLISPELLVEEGFLSLSEIPSAHEHSPDEVDYHSIYKYKNLILKAAFEKYKEKLYADKAYQDFCKNSSYWLEDYALFLTLKESFHGAIWNEWPVEYRDRNPEALAEWQKKHSEKIDLEKFIQYVFFKQWKTLKKHSKGRNVQIIGDLPIYVCYDSADVWSHSNIFKLNPDKKPVFVAGVPPDYFSKTGQLWGNPVYDWDMLKNRGFDWWIKRMDHNLNLFDIIRLDHFRGFVSYWEIPGGETTAMIGKWVDVPVRDFFNLLQTHFSKLPIIAEDLGIMTDEVKEVMKHYQLPGMKILLFAFSGDLKKHPYLPHNYEKNCVVYTGTHDNNTTKGWYHQEITPEILKNATDYLGRPVSDKTICWDLIELAMSSVADLVVIPMQDYLELGEAARMNTPGTLSGNWKWRLTENELTAILAEKIVALTFKTGRSS